MKKFVFSLERMLNYQTQNLDKEMGTLGRLTAVRDDLETRVKGMEGTIAGIRAEMARQESEGTTVFLLKASFSVLESARHQLKELNEDLGLAQARVEKQQRVVLEASREVKKLEKLKENQIEEYRRGEAKEQQETIAEHVAGDFVRRGDSI